MLGNVKGSDYRLCPLCASRNKIKWEFCLRCGESLQGVTVGVPVKAGPPVATGKHAGRPWPALLALLVAVGAIGALVAAVRTEPVSTPAAVIFSVPTAPAAEPTPVTVDRPGDKEFREGCERLAGGDPIAAGEFLARAVEAQPDRPHYRYMYATAAWRSGDRERAVEAFEAAVRLSPDATQYRSDLARALETAGKAAEAIREYEVIAAQRPGDVTTQRALGKLYALHGNPEKAIAMLRQAAEKDPGDLRLQTALGLALEKSGDTEAAVETYRRVQAAAGNGATINRGLLAEALFRKGKREEAVALVREGLAGRGGDAPLHRLLASLLERSGRTAEAAAAYKEYARLAPAEPDAKELAERASRLEEAARPPAG